MRTCNDEDFHFGDPAEDYAFEQSRQRELDARDKELAAACLQYEGAVRIEAMQRMEAA